MLQNTLLHHENAPYTIAKVCIFMSDHDGEDHAQISCQWEDETNRELPR